MSLAVVVVAAAAAAAAAAAVVVAADAAAADAVVCVFCFFRVSSFIGRTDRSRVSECAGRKTTKSEGNSQQQGASSRDESQLPAVLKLLFLLVGLTSESASVRLCRRAGWLGGREGFAVWAAHRQRGQ